MFGFSFWEIAIILAIALIVLGPSKLPELAKSFGKSLREFRKATEDFKSTIDQEQYREDPPKPLIANRTAAATGVDPVIKPVDAVIEPTTPTPPSAAPDLAKPDLTKP